MHCGAANCNNYKQKTDTDITIFIVRYGWEYGVQMGVGVGCEKSVEIGIGVVSLDLMIFGNFNLQCYEYEQ